MDPIAAKYIGAGIACIGMGGAGAGVGIIFGNYLAAAVRNPSAAQGQFGNLIFGFAVTEALGIFSLLIALLLLFGFYPQPMINVVEQTASTTMNVVGMTDPLPGSMGGK